MDYSSRQYKTEMNNPNLNFTESAYKQISKIKSSLITDFFSKKLNLFR